MVEFMILIVIVSVVITVLIAKGTSHVVQSRPHRQIKPTRVDELSTLRNDDGCGEWIVSVYRQSGNPYKDDEIYPSKGDAINKVMRTFKAAGEDSPIITRKTQSLVEFKRWGFVHDEHPNGYNSKVIGTIIISKM